jgi:putative hydrolase of the HAD superfamily
MTRKMERNMTNLPQAIFLDMDDTIISFSASTDACWEEVCRQFAPRINGFTADTLRAAIRQTSAWFWGDPERHRRGRLNMLLARRELVRQALVHLNIEAPHIARELADAYSAARDQSIELFPGALDTLRHWRSQGIRLALLTNGGAVEQQGKIERFGLAPFFDCIVIEGEFGVGKPDEKVYRFALKRMDVEPAQVWMIGDNLEWDVAGAQKVGIWGIWLDVEHRGLPPASRVQPDRVIRSLVELVETAT